MTDAASTGGVNTSFWLISKFMTRLWRLQEAAAVG
jgi:hypothetical protein